MTVNSHNRCRWVDSCRRVDLLRGILASLFAHDQSRTGQKFNFECSRDAVISKVQQVERKKSGIIEGLIMTNLGKNNSETIALEDSTHLVW